MRIRYLKSKDILDTAQYTSYTQQKLTSFVGVALGPAEGALDGFLLGLLLGLVVGSISRSVDGDSEADDPFLLGVDDGSSVGKKVGM